MGILSLGFFGDIVAQHAYLNGVPLPQRRAWIFNGEGIGIVDDPSQEALIFTVDPVLHEPNAALADADDTITIGQGHRRAQNVLTDNRSHVVSVADAVEGELLFVQRTTSNGFNAEFVNGGPGAGILAVLPGNSLMSAWFQFNGADWVLYQFTQYGNASQTEDGLMAYRDKRKLDHLNVLGAALVDGGEAIAISGGSVRHLPPATLTADATLRLDTAGASGGDEMWITRQDITAFDYVIANLAAVPLVMLPPGVRSWAVFDFDEIANDWISRASGVSL